LSSNADILYFIVSPQQEYRGDDDVTEGKMSSNNNQRPLKNCSIDEQVGVFNRDNERENDSNNNIEIIESIEMDGIISYNDIDVIILSTTSQDVIHDDPFINDFLRRTDAAIYMSSDYTDEFCYYARIQEGANITLW